MSKIAIFCELQNTLPVRGVSLLFHIIYKPIPFSFCIFHHGMLKIHNLWSATVFFVIIFWCRKFDVHICRSFFESHAKKRRNQPPRVLQNFESLLQRVNFFVLKGLRKIR